MYRNFNNFYTLIRNPKGKDLLFLGGVTAEQIPEWYLCNARGALAPMEVTNEVS